MPGGISATRILTPPPEGRGLFLHLLFRIRVPAQLDSSGRNITGNIYASAGVDTMLFDANGQGGLYASIGVNMDTPPLDTDGDGKVPRTEHAFLFNVSGGLHAYLNAYVEVGVEVFGEFVGYREEFNLVDETIGSMSTYDVPNPFIPVLPLWLAGSPSTATPNPNDPNELHVTEPNGVLTLNVGPLKSNRGPDAYPGEESETYIIMSQTDGNSEVIVVSAFGFTQRFHGVQKIVADAGIGSDRIEIAEEVTVPVELHGGAGDDQLRYRGSGQAVLYGDAGNDLLESGTGDNNQLYGGDHDDVLKAASLENPQNLSNELHGGYGDDELYAGQGFSNNSPYGENGNDSLFASDCGDRLEGGFGDDLIQTGAGGDFVICGAGDDRVTWEVGSQTASIYGYSDTLPPDLSNVHGYNSVGIKGTGNPDTFDVSDVMIGGIPHFTQVMHAGTGMAVVLAQIDGVAIEAIGGADTITVHDLSSTSIQDVCINTGDIINPDNLALDQIFVEGTAWPDTVVVSLQEAALYPPPHGGEPTLGGITVMEFVPHYEVKMANVMDHVELSTFGGQDLLEVHGISGPTWIETAQGDDQIHVVANATQFPLLFGGDSEFLAPLEVETGTGANRMFFTIDGAPQVPQEEVRLTDHTLKADHLIPDSILFTATGGDFTGGIWLDTGSADDTVYVQNTLPGVNTLVTTGHGADTIRLSSDATLEGNLATIEGPIKVNAGSGGNYLHLVDYGAASGNALVEVLTGSMVGLAGPTDNIPVLYEAVGGTYSQIHLYASDDPSVNEEFRIHKPNGPFLLDRTAVLDDGAKDVPQGDPGLDWFFAKLSNPHKDKLADYTAGLGEEVDWL